jgi:hypothetical protein
MMNNQAHFEFGEKTEFSFLTKRIVYFPLQVIYEKF